jgi:hypothetical protein
MNTITLGGERRHTWTAWLVGSLWLGCVLTIAVATWLAFLSRGYSEAPGLMPAFGRVPIFSRLACP